SQLLYCIWLYCRILSNANDAYFFTTFSGVILHCKITCPHVTTKWMNCNDWRSGFEGGWILYWRPRYSGSSY
uniref:Uncharacterized protein n=1 Tax=Petromyzon marinus TaxID=7757 RepID=S4RVF2_PETMA